MAPPLHLVIPSLVGAATITWATWHITRFLTFHFWLPAHPLDAYKSKSPSAPNWAFVTGSSAGIGYAYAAELMHLGFDVIIHSHVAPELEASAAELRRLRPGAQVRTLHYDAVTFTAAELAERVEAVTAGLPVAILINNVGSIPISGDPFKEFSAYDGEDIDRCIALNASFMTHMTHMTRLMLPTLSRSSRSLTLNVTSAARVGMPWLSLYSATKAYNAGFSTSVCRELRAAGRTDVDCLLLAVDGDVVSQGNRLGLAPEGSILAKDYARMALERVDSAVRRGMVQLNPYWKHELLFAIMPWVPESAVQAAVTEQITQKKEGFYKLQ
ncbi:Uu.00g069610.m01.CDS01 [Anthostomella pinea]|uniref:Uu.00g069610.m01.CDS01 n=1 Tax=Anthostomella pinea TaxID=933095 RepID=A0AAI8VNY1_9PEZI|nr:Uu.00g069610.m01.CDS01 [Anthostomella pinea]